MIDEKLRVGILLDPGPVPRWVRAALERVQRSDHSELVLVVLNGAPISRRSLLRRLWDGRGTALYGLFARVDAKLSGVEEDPFEPTTLDDVTRSVPTITVRPTQTRFSDRLLPRDVETIRAQRVDVLVRFGFRILRGEILEAARYGVWSYHHGDGLAYRGSPAGIWELLEGRPVTGCVLQILTEDLDAGRVIFRSFGRTDRTRMRRGVASSYWKSSAFLARELARLRSLGAERFFARVEANEAPLLYSGRLHRAPRNVEMLPFLARHVLALLGRKLRSVLIRERWVLLYALDRIERPMPFLERFHRIVPPRDRFWADPFAAYALGHHYIFFEEGIEGEPRGHISCLMLDRSGHHGPPRIVLERPYHLSYPFVFQHEGTYYMIPETADNNAIELYRCTRFPDGWERAVTLVDGIYAVDPTLVQDGGRWWLFANVREHPGASTLDELFLFSSSELLSSEWVPHPANPIVSDVRRARPAGRPFRRGGAIFRPAQDCAERYGHAIVINRIVTMTMDRYEEEPVGRIAPEWDRRIVAVHTLDRSGALTVLDGLLERGPLHR